MPPGHWYAMPQPPSEGELQTRGTASHGAIFIVLGVAGVMLTAARVPAFCVRFAAVRTRCAGFVRGAQRCFGVGICG